MARCLLINNDGAGFADYIEVAEGTTVEKLFAQRVLHGRPEDYLIRVNRQPVAADQVLQEGDRVSITPTKIEGAPSKRFWTVMGPATMRTILAGPFSSCKEFSMKRTNQTLMKAAMLIHERLAETPTREELIDLPIYTWQHIQNLNGRSTKPGYTAGRVRQSGLTTTSLALWPIVVASWMKPTLPANRKPHALPQGLRRRHLPGFYGPERRVYEPRHRHQGT